MTIKKVWIEEGCIACGLCEKICPEVFELKDLATIIEGVNYADYEGQIKEASECCPVEVIKFQSLHIYSRYGVGAYVIKKGLSASSR